jgi:hypothetical protein
MQNEFPERVMCPLIDAEIDDVDCIENQDVVDGFIVEKSIPTKFKSKPGWRSICQKCKYRQEE